MRRADSSSSGEPRSRAPRVMASESVSGDFDPPKPAPLRRFPTSATSFVVRLDQQLSALLAAATLPRPLEALLFVPAHAFGAPLCSLCTVPCLLGLLVDSPATILTPSARLFVAFAGVLASGVPLLLVRTGAQPASIFHKGRHVGLAALAALLGLRLTSTTGFDAACLYVVGWLHTTVLLFTMKGYYARPRPACNASGTVENNVNGNADNCSPAPLGILRRAYEERRARWPAVVTPHTQLPNALHSFPSMDAAAAGCFAGALLASTIAYPAGDAAEGARVADRVRLAFSFGVCALASYGRVYFLAHHLIDVAVGTMIGAGLTGGLGCLVPPSAYPFYLLTSALGPLTVAGFFLGWRSSSALAVTSWVGVAVAASTSASPATCLAVPGVFAGVLALLVVVFRAQCRHLQPHILSQLRTFWEAHAEPPAGLLPPPLLSALHQVSGSVGQWVSGSVGPWVSGSVGPWVSGSVGQWVSGSVGQWVSGLSSGSVG